MKLMKAGCRSFVKDTKAGKYHERWQLIQKANAELIQGIMELKLMYIRYFQKN
jgi:hypothetical protein